MLPFLIAFIASVFGIIMGLYLKNIALIIFMSIICLFIIFTFKKYIKYILIFIISFLAFFTYTISVENKYEKIYKDYENKEIHIQAIVVSNPQEKEYKNVYEIQILEIQNKKLNYFEQFKLICNVKNEKNSNLQYGDKIELISTYKTPSIERNEGGFNYMQYLKTKKVAGTIDINIEDIKLISKNEISAIKRLIHNFKNNLIINIKEVMPNDTAGICIGLLLGDKSFISKDIQNKFKQSSLSHILAISGAHVSYILLGITTFFSFLKLHKRWGKILIIIFLVFFMTLVGFTPSVTRACTMSIISMLADILFRKSNIYQNISISSIIILLINPYYLLDIGFQLSFGGTIGIILFMQNQENKKEQINSNEKQVTKYRKKLTKILFGILNNIKQIILVSLSANLIIIPIMMFHFNTFSVTFLISNIFASPLLEVCLTLGLIFIIILIYKPIATLISYFLNPCLQILIQVANITSKLPFSQILVPTPKIWQILLYYLSLVLILLSKKAFTEKQSNYYLILKKYKKRILILQILIILAPYFIKFPTFNLNIYFIDVGQGDSTLIQTPNMKTILIDGGGSEMSNFNVGENTLLPYLLDKNIMKIDYIMFSHFDTDHCQGLLTVLEKLKVSNIIISIQGKNSNNFKQLLKIIENKKINIIIAKAGDKIKIDKECYFDILFPENKLITDNILNNNSIVAKFYYKNNFSILFTGDIEKIAEERLVEMYNKKSILESTILKVAHHGSKTSSTEDLLELINPKIALIGVGENNNFGHPNEITLQNLKKYGAKILRTDELGEISIVVNRKGIITKINKCVE